MKRNPKLDVWDRMAPMEKYILFDDAMVAHKTSSLWFITQLRKGKKLYETVLDPRTESEKSEDSMDYHDLEPSITEIIAQHQKIFRNIQESEEETESFPYRFAPPGVYLRELYEPVEREPFFHRPRDKYYFNKVKYEWFKARRSSRWSIREIKYRWGIFKRWCIATGSHPPDYKPYKLWDRYEDLNEELIVDRSRKDFEEDQIYPETKVQVYSTIWQRFQEDITEKIMKQRKYWKRHRRMYRYIPARLSKYPAWKKEYIEGLKEMFQKHDPNLEGFIDMDTMNELLDELGDKTPPLERAGYFNYFANSPYLPEELIEFHEFLHIVYSLTVPKPDPPDFDPDPDTPEVILKKDPMDKTYRRKYQYYDEISRNKIRARMFCNCF